MSNLMAFDTVFEQCSIALLTDGAVIYEQTVAGGRGQTEIILSLVDEALSQTNIKLSNIDCLAFNRGPGAFSGIRINTAVVQALSVAHETLCVGVSSLAPKSSLCW
ncbi:Inactive like of metal-dependent protease, putative molecular chaperone [Moraxella catarrhalis]|nr:tRNA (adenosine(37)-N6)-threonylcarbamoyltransferase complex dimerization subunit type 1 TsaB [Moraxella catarrhalis]OAV07034.1 Inactive like of metal-dependent protease, putative molecular chaperone [Moraxella catarrhalis]